MSFRPFADTWKHPLEVAPDAGAYLPVLLTRLGKNSGAQGGRSLTYVLGNMLSAGGAAFTFASPAPWLLCSSNLGYCCHAELQHTLSVCRLLLELLAQHGFDVARLLVQSWCQRASCTCWAQP